jgi:hypothetical protein
MTHSRPGAILALLLLATAPAAAEAPRLPSPEEVFVVSIKPHARQLTSFFTPESLLAALPRFKRVWVNPPIGGKIWNQSGVIVLNDRRVLYWRSYRDDVLVLETDAGPEYFVIDE